MERIGNPKALDTHREQLEALLAEAAWFRELVKENTGLPLATDEEWKIATRALVDMLGIYDGDRLKPNWRDVVERGPHDG